jgi:hypothetical protein
MALELCRRHRKECEGGHPEDSKTGEFEEGRRGWKKCACLIHVSSTVNGIFNRQQTGKPDWDEAKVIASQWEAAKSWNGVPKEPLTDPPQKARRDHHRRRNSCLHGQPEQSRNRSTNAQ